MISPFGVGEGGVRIEDLDDAGFVTRSPLGVLGRSLIDGWPTRATSAGCPLGDQQGAGRHGLIDCPARPVGKPSECRGNQRKIGGPEGLLLGMDDNGRRVRQHHCCGWFRDGAREI
jgi:hypothetical protein